MLRKAILSTINAGLISVTMAATPCGGLEVNTHRLLPGRMGGDTVAVDAAVTSMTNVPALLCGRDTVTPIITLKNNGQDLLTTVEIGYGLVGGPQYTLPWAGSLQSGQTTTVSLAPLGVQSGANTITARCTAPNGQSDEIPENDSWSTTFDVSMPAGLVNLILTLDDFGSDVTWELGTSDMVVLYSGGPYADNQNGETDSVAFCLTNGCYTFTINDAFGNGICCTDGDGAFVIRDTTGHAYVTHDGIFEQQSISTFCLEAVSVAESEAGVAQLYPNPTSGELHLRGIPGKPILGILVLDGLGRTVAQVPLQGEPVMHIQLDLPAGSYMIQFLHPTGQTSTGLMITN